MTLAISPFDGARIRRFTRRRDEAVRAIEFAFVALEQRPATPDQLGDLRDAIEALRDGQFYASVLLAWGATRSLPLDIDRGPPRTLQDLRAEFAELRAGREPGR